jgi:hypothetical protein
LYTLEIQRIELIIISLTGFPEHVDLFLSQFGNQVWTRREMEEQPGSGGSTGMLAGHEQGNHDMCNLFVRQWTPIFVRLSLQVIDHVPQLAFPVILSSFVDDVEVKVSHRHLRTIATTIRGQGQVGKRKM